MQIQGLPENPNTQDRGPPLSQLREGLTGRAISAGLFVSYPPTSGHGRCLGLRRCRGWQDGLGAKVRGLGLVFGVWYLGFGIWGLVFGVWYLGFVGGGGGRAYGIQTQHGYVSTSVRGHRECLSGASRLGSLRGNLRQQGTGARSCQLPRKPAYLAFRIPKYPSSIRTNQQGSSKKRLRGHSHACDGEEEF